MTRTQHTVRVHACLGDPESLPEVAISRLRDALGSIEFNVDVEARIKPERPELGQPRHELIIASFTFNPTTRFEVPTADLTDEQARKHLGWTEGTYLDYPDDPDDYETWEDYEDDAEEKQLSERPLPDTVWFDYFDDAAELDNWGVDVGQYFDVGTIVDDTTELAVQSLADQVLHDVGWYIVYHTAESDDGSRTWGEVVRTDGAPDEL